MRDDQSAGQCVQQESYPKTRTDPLGIGPGATVGQAILAKLTRLDAAKQQVLSECAGRINAIEDDRRALLSLVKSFSLETLNARAREVRELLA